MNVSIPTLVAPGLPAHSINRRCFMRKILMLAVCGAGLLLFGSENTAKADHNCYGNYGYGGVYAGPVYGGYGYAPGYTYGYSPAVYSYPYFGGYGGYGGYYGGSSLYIGIGGRRGYGSFGYYRGGRSYYRRGWGGRRW
jgi:hypothetical protein